MSRLDEVKALAAGIAANLPKSLDAASLTLNSKVPFKAFQVRELSIHRISDLANGSVLLFESGSDAPAITLVRAVQETFALLYVLHKKTQGFLETKNVGEYDAFLMKCLVGSKQDPTVHEALNALTNIDHFDKIVPGFRKTYESLCEFAHPNWSGLLGSYGRIDTERHITHFGARNKAASMGIGLASLSGALIASVHYYNKVGEEIAEVNSYFEAAT